MRILSKHGHPLLYLPANPRAAESTLDLYPAQTGPARLLRGGLKLLCRLQLPIPFKQGELPFSVTHPLKSFLQELAETEDPITLGVLAGNPGAPGRRFIALLFARNKPTAVVKIGFDTSAREKIAAETDILSRLTPSIHGSPAVLSRLDEPDIAALALQFVDGKPANAGNITSKVLGEILESWILKDAGEIPLSSIPAFQRLQRRLQTSPREAKILPLLERISSERVAPVLYHGDLAPWNIRIQKNVQPVVLDWERGEPVGVPCWDWFHCIIQPALLVKRLSPVPLADKLQDLIVDPVFAEYARRTGCEKILPELALCYLHFLVLEHPHTEGKKSLQALAETILQHMGGSS